MIGVVVLAWEDVLVSTDMAPRELAARLNAVLDHGVDIVLVTALSAAEVVDALGGRPVGPGRLLAWSTATTEVEEIRGTAMTSVGPPHAPRAPAQHVTDAETVHADDDPSQWSRRWLLGRGGPEDVLVVGDGHLGTTQLSAEASPLAMLDSVLAAHASFPVPTESPGWRVDVEGADPLREQDIEAWLTVANGRCGTRGSVDGGAPGSAAAVYVAGVYAWSTVEPPGPELLRGPDWTSLGLQVGGERLDPGSWVVLGHRRVLDMWQGTLFWDLRVRLSSDAEVTVRSARLASLADRSLLAVEAQATLVPEEALPVSFGDAAWPPLGQDTVAAVTTRVEGATLVSLDTGHATASFRIATHQEAGRLWRLTAVDRTGLDAGDEGAAALARAQAGGAPALRAYHRRAWRERWRDADIVVVGDDDAQRALRFALYHLISSGDPESGAASIGARGLTGPGYRGHVFWDTDVFVLPHFIWTHPPTARALLTYRYSTLPAARAKAARLGYKGALYAWESADTGEECTPSFVMLPDGTRLEIRTDVEEHHIAADVAWAVWQYWRVTADDDFLVSMGAEIIVETARFWTSRARPDDEGRHHIDGVIGPDEYHEGVNDNAYTNALARWNLLTAVEVVELMSTAHAAAWTDLSRRLGLEPAEVRAWGTVARSLVDGFDAATLLYEQFAGYFALDDVRAADLAERPFAAELVMGVPQLRRSQIIKQPDVLMLAHMLPDLVPVEVALANYRLYEPRTSHGSSLSPAIHAAVAARVGALSDAASYFRVAAGVDLDDRMGNAAQGVHIATMGGLWQATVLGFGGVRPDGEALRLDPRLPAGWQALSFSVRWRGARVDVEIDGDELHLHLEGQTTVVVGDGAPGRVGPGHVVLARTADGWAGR